MDSDSQKLILFLDIWVFSLSFSRRIFIWRTDWTKFEVPENSVFCVGSGGWIIGRFFLSQMLAKYHKLINICKNIHATLSHPLFRRSLASIIWKHFVSITIISWLINIFTCITSVYLSLMNWGTDFCLNISFVRTHFWTWSVCLRLLHLRVWFLSWSIVFRNCF